MRFGSKLQSSVYEPWKDSYLHYAKLKGLLYEGQSEEEWGERQESRFVEELDSELEKIYAFQHDISQQLENKIAELETEADGYSKETKLDPRIKTRINKELDEIVDEIKELEKFSRINFTGFMKIAKKHDKLFAQKWNRTDFRHSRYTVRPLLQVRLRALPFNSEDYSILLQRLSVLYSFIRQEDEHETAADRRLSLLATSIQSVVSDSVDTRVLRTTYKFWVHLDNLMEVKTFILRRLPLLVYDSEPRQKPSARHNPDPTVTNLYFDDSSFTSYMSKLERATSATSLRLRWYGKLNEQSEVAFEKKVTNFIENAEDVETRFMIKKKYVKDFLEGKYSMEKNIKKMRDGAKKDAEIRSYQEPIKEIQNMIQERDLSPVLRVTYTRAAFQIPGDDSVRINLDHDIALIREDALDEDRPCRDPNDWHRRDIDDPGEEYPFPHVRKGEISRFPYAVLEIKTSRREQVPPSTNINNNGTNHPHFHPSDKDPQWVSDLMKSHLVKEAPRFSKYAHGVSVLFESYVNLLPFWLSEMDEDIRRDPQQLYEEQQERRKSGAQKVVWGPRQSWPTSGSESSRSKSSKGKQPALDELPPVPKITVTETSESSEDTGPKGLRTVRSLLSLVKPTSPGGRSHSPVRLPPGVRKPTSFLKNQGPIKVETKVWLANERTFIKWMHVSTLMATLSLALYNGAASVGNSLASNLGAVYVLISVTAAVWAYYVYMSRAKEIRNRSPKHMDDRIGPILVGIALIVALSANFVFKYTLWLREGKDLAKPATVMQNGVFVVQG